MACTGQGRRAGGGGSHLPSPASTPPLRPSIPPRLQRVGSGQKVGLGTVSRYSCQPVWEGGVVVAVMGGNGGQSLPVVQVLHVRPGAAVRLHCRRHSPPLMEPAPGGRHAGWDERLPRPPRPLMSPPSGENGVPVLPPVRPPSPACSFASVRRCPPARRSSRPRRPLVPSPPTSCLAARSPGCLRRYHLLPPASQAIHAQTTAPDQRRHRNRSDAAATIQSRRIPSVLPCWVIQQPVSSMPLVLATVACLSGT